MEARALWEQALEELRNEVSRGNFETWFKGTEGLGWDGRKLTVGVATDFQADWLRTRLASVVRRVVRRVSGEEAEVEFRVARRNPGPATRDAREEGPAAPRRGGRTFEDFVVLDSNRMAFEAVRAVAVGNGVAAVTVVGPTGVGKTHLLEAASWELGRQGGRVLYLDGQELTDRWVRAAKNGTADRFVEELSPERVDVLVLDDLDLVSTKTQAPELIFKAYNGLMRSGGRMLFATSTPPAALPFERRLISRLLGGLVAEIAAPTPSELRELARRKAEARRLSIPEAGLALIAEKCPTPREVEGALNRVAELARLSGRAPSYETVAAALRVFGVRGGISAEVVLRVVAEYFQVDIGELTGPSRERRVTEPRHVAAYLLREDAGLSFAQVGKALGGRDHTSAMNSVCWTEMAIKKGGEVERAVAAIRLRLYGRPHPS